MRDRAIALYGRFRAGERERLEAAIGRLGGAVARDLTRRSDILVVGALATALIDSGALADRIHAARERGVPVRGERTFAAALAGEEQPKPASVPLATALGGTALTPDDAEVLAAFDLILLDGDLVRFGDAPTLRTAADLMAHGRTLGEAVRILARARDLAPVGRYRIVLTPAGDAALKWADGVTTLEGQGQLAFDEAHATVDDLFEAAAVAEAEGDLEAAAHLYDLCARADRRDAIAPYNHGNIRLAQGAFDQARLAYQRALARDPKLLEARYNLAQALDAEGRADAASDELVRVLDADPRYSDAVFNLAQLRMKAGALADAAALYRRYLTLDPPEDWARTARRAILYCSGVA
ncbi:MAG: tetratricopeptide repeat protein [Phenylobacterium sp.]|uniref:tetratricopeptide repeat protein n=1 Tax=Phenylobacterium sp. TaxID=1871053 RepID=UPI001A44AE6B|nr:tetratricopeptide repeat protein [Phenylobacterium sp.]MBL8556972.1 tetratricopeptide repeat protein [Phenylobacterium sp.]